MTAAELNARLDICHRPYHQAIADELGALVACQGGAVLLDLHSMPPRPRGGAQLVIGDRHGTAAADWLTRLALRTARAQGFSVALNDPFAGGHIVARHGRPNANVHALQIEIDRGCYLTRDGRKPGPGFERVALLIDQLALALGDSLAAGRALAAE